MQGLTTFSLTPIFNRKGQLLLLSKKDRWYIPQFNTSMTLRLSQTIIDIVQKELGIPLSRVWSPINNIYKLSEANQIEDLKVMPGITDIDFVSKYVGPSKWIYLKDIDEYKLPSQIKEVAIKSFYRLYENNEFLPSVNPININSDFSKGISY
jgi:hypothetical protein